MWKFIAKAVMISALGRQLVLQGTRCNTKGVNNGGWGSSKVVRPDLGYVLLFDPRQGGGHVQKKS